MRRKRLPSPTGIERLDGRFWKPREPDKSEFELTQADKERQKIKFDERKTIIESISYVDEVIDFEDDEIGSCIHGLEKVKNLFPTDKLFFANGGDQNNNDIPEKEICNKLGIKLIDGLGDKIQSSSWLLNKDND